MSQETILSGSENTLSFRQFLFSERRNRRLLGIAGIAVILQFIIFKTLYPFADFFSDSYSYIYGASAHLDINIWPIGYSKFLAAFHDLTHSDTAVVGFQYFFLEISSLYFFFTILYFYNPGKGTRNILFIFLFFNPLFLYLSNYINSDPLFAAISLAWFTELLWILNRPKPYHILTQGILLFLAFTIRNNAYYYPFICTFVFLLSRQKWSWKLAGVALPIVLIVPFVIHTRDAAKEITDTEQFSLFTGWQLANNALYMYGHIQVDSAKLPTAETRELNTLSKNFYSIVPPDFGELLYNYGANFFIREPAAPMKQYFRKHYKPKDDYEEVRDWGRASVVFEGFGKYLIKNYPLAYVKHFMLLNTNNYFYPPLEKLEIYNLGENNVPLVVEDWFDYKTPEVSSVSKDVQSYILFPFPYLFMFINVLFAGSLIWLLIKRQQKQLNRELRNTMLLAIAFLAANFCFCVFATIIVLRYQFFPMIITLTFPLLLIEFLDKKQTVSKRLPGSATNPMNLELSNPQITH